jgi:hypothetical protein
MRSFTVNAEILERAKLFNDTTVTLYDWMAQDVRDGRNLIATNPDGTERWRAKPVIYNYPAQEDCFTAIRWDGASLTAYTWSGYKVAVDPDDGSVRVLEFTK